MNPIVSDLCPVYAPFFGCMGETAALVFCGEFEGRGGRSLCWRCATRRAGALRRRDLRGGVSVGEARATRRSGRVEAAARLPARCASARDRRLFVSVVARSSRVGACGAWRREPSSKRFSPSPLRRRCAALRGVAWRVRVMTRQVRIL